MSPAFATALATRMWPLRLVALLLAVVAFMTVAVAAVYGSPSTIRLAAALAGPAVGLPWAVLCVTSWFHPASGTMSSSARFMSRLPRWLRSGVRWYASLFLAVFVPFCAVAWPLFSYSNLWHLAQ